MPSHLDPTFLFFFLDKIPWNHGCPRTAINGPEPPTLPPPTKVGDYRFTLTCLASEIPSIPSLQNLVWFCLVSFSFWFLRPSFPDPGWSGTQGPPTPPPEFRDHRSVPPGSARVWESAPCLKYSPCERMWVQFNGKREETGKRAGGRESSSRTRHIS